MLDFRYKTKIKDIQDKYKFKIFCYDATGTSIADFNANAAQKTQEFNQNAIDKTNDFDEHASSIQAELEEVQQELEKAQQDLKMYKMLENALPKVEGEGESITLDGTAQSPMKMGFKGQIKQDGEPTPNNPVDIHIVSGDNKINISSGNLLLNETWNTGGYLDSNNAVVSNVSWKYSDYINISSKNFIYEPNVVGNTPKTILYDENKNIVSTLNLKKVVYNLSTYNAKYIRISTTNDVTPKLYQEYTKEINLEELEVGGIGEYEDEFFKNVEGTEYYDSTLELDKWYLKKRIGKLVLDGSEDIIVQYGGKENSTFFTFRDIVSIPTPTTEAGLGYSNLFKAYVQTLISDYDTEGFAISAAGNLRINILNSRINISLGDNKVAKFKTYLSTNKPIFKLPLATPTNILLNDTLQETLDSFYSMQGQTNISQENNDLPFVIKASAIYDLSNLLPSGASLTTSSTASLNKLEKTDLKETPLEVENIEEETSEE